MEESSSQSRPKRNRDDNTSGNVATEDMGAPSTSKRSCQEDTICLSLYVKWLSSTGRARVTAMDLSTLKCVGDLDGLPKRLVQRAFNDTAPPPHLSNPDYTLFSSREPCLSLPGDVARTEFRLVAKYDGWEYVVLKRELGMPIQGNDDLFITVIEFESIARVFGHLGIRLAMVAYPIIAIKKAFLKDVEDEIKNNPTFQGILS